MKKKRKDFPYKVIVVGDTGSVLFFNKYIFILGVGKSW